MQLAHDSAAPHFVVFEGLDGTGKTSCARALAAHLGADFLTTPSEALRPHRDAILRSTAGSQEAAQLFYLSAVFAASADVEGRLAAGHSVVLDRYFLSTQAYAAFRGSALGLDELCTRLAPAHLTVLLEAPYSVRCDRLLARGATDADRETVRPGAQPRLMEEHLRREGLPVVGRLLRLDTSSLTPAEVVARVASELQRAA